MASFKRETTRLAQVEKVKETARMLLARHGPMGLSLREVAREMCQTSSALYRYFHTRDELLTALIVDAYNDLGATTEAAEAKVARENLNERWRVTCHTVRNWALSHPHEYALIFGSPIPGYEAPQLTVAAAARVTGVMAGIIRDQFSEVTQEFFSDPRVEEALLFDNVEYLLPNVPHDVAVRSVFAWTQIFGFISFELFGHLLGTVSQTDVTYGLLIEQTAQTVGLVDQFKPRT